MTTVRVYSGGNCFRFLNVFFWFVFGNLSGRPCLVEYEGCGSSVVNKVGWGWCVQLKNLGFFYLLERGI